jgi:hypothetical protein
VSSHNIPVKTSPPRSRRRSRSPGATAYAGTTYPIHRAESDLRESRDQQEPPLIDVRVCLPLLGCLL